MVKEKGRQTSNPRRRGKNQNEKKNQEEKRERKKIALGHGCWNIDGSKRSLRG